MGAAKSIRRRRRESQRVNVKERKDSRREPEKIKKRQSWRLKKRKEEKPSEVGGRQLIKDGPLSSLVPCRLLWILALIYRHKGIDCLSSIWYGEYSFVFSTLPAEFASSSNINITLGAKPRPSEEHVLVLPTEAEWGVGQTLCASVQIKIIIIWNSGNRMS